MPGKELTRDGLPVRDRITTAMLQRCGELGYGSLSVEDVCECFGGTAEDFYSEFGDVGECFAAAYEVEGERACERWVQLAGRGDWRREQLRNALYELADYVEQQPAMARSLFLEVHAAGEAAKTKRLEVFDRLAGTFAGRVDSDFPRPTTRGAFAVGAVDGTFSRTLLQGKQDRLKSIVPELVEVVSTALRM